MRSKRLLAIGIEAVVLVVIVGGVSISSRKGIESITSVETTEVIAEAEFKWTNVDMDIERLRVLNNTSIYTEPRYLADVVVDIESGKEGIASAYCEIEGSDNTGWYKVAIGSSEGYMSMDSFEFIIEDENASEYYDLFPEESTEASVVEEGSEVSTEASTVEETTKSVESTTTGGTKAQETKAPASTTAAPTQAPTPTQPAQTQAPTQPAPTEVPANTGGLNMDNLTPGSGQGGAGQAPTGQGATGFDNEAGIGLE